MYPAGRLCQVKGPYIVSARFIKDQQSVTRSIAGETIIVPIKSGVGDLDSIYTLNEVGTRIWQLIDGVRTAEGIVNIITEEYDVTPEAAAQDVSDLLGALEAEGLIRQLAESEE